MFLKFIVVFDVRVGEDGRVSFLCRVCLLSIVLLFFSVFSFDLV